MATLWRKLVYAGHRRQKMRTLRHAGSGTLARRYSLLPPRASLEKIGTADRYGLYIYGQARESVINYGVQLTLSDAGRGSRNRFRDRQNRFSSLSMTVHRRAYWPQFRPAVAGSRISGASRFHSWKVTGLGMKHRRLAPRAGR